MNYRKVIEQGISALNLLVSENGETFGKAMDVLFARWGRIITTGIGKSGHVAANVASTMSSTGTPAFFVHPTDAAHGDLGCLSPGDAVLMFSRSGRAAELQVFAEFCKNKGIPIVLVSENDRDSLANYAAVVLYMPKAEEAWGHAPTISTLMQMAIGSAAAVELAFRNGFTDEQFRETHPGGELGEKSPYRKYYG